MVPPALLSSDSAPDQPASSTTPLLNDKVSLTTKDDSGDDSKDERYVQSVWDEHRQWSQVAADKKREVQRSRSAVLMLTVSGAFLQTLGAQLPTAVAWGWLVSVSGGVFLGLAPLLSGKYLSQQNVEDRVTSRVLSEALKAEVYKFRAGAAPYSDKDKHRGITLIKKAENLSKNLLGKDNGRLATLRIAKRTDGKPPPTVVGNVQKWYKLKRVEHEIQYREEEAPNLAKKAQGLRRWEFSFSAMASVLGVVVGSVGGAEAASASASELVKKIGVWAAVVTTAGMAFSTHLSASQLYEQTRDLDEAAQSLKNFLFYYGQEDDPSEGDWTKFVNNCEDTIFGQTNSWAAMRKKSAAQKS